jgi:porin
MNKIFIAGNVCLLMLATLWALPVFAQSPQPNSGFGGPSSVTGTFDKDRESKPAVQTNLFDDYFAFKKRMEDTHGLSFGLDYNALFQSATESLGEATAAGGVFRAYGNWTLVGKDSGNTGLLVFKVENSHRLGTDIAPTALGGEVGYEGLTSITFSDIGWALTTLHWSQRLMDNQLAFSVGIVDVTDDVDTYGLVDPWTDFSNLAFSNGPTTAAPSQGLGGALYVRPAENFYLLGGIADANGDPTDPGNAFDSFFNDAEFFTHIEAGWISSWERRFSDNIHLTAWHTDERKQAQVSDGWGMAFSFSRLFADTWEPFFRAGYAEDGGALWECSIGAGVGYHTRKKGDLLGVGLNWSRPSEDAFGPGLDDQYTAEIYYRLQLLKVLIITPDVQLLVNPALNPDHDLVAIFGIRGRICF